MKFYWSKNTMHQGGIMCTGVKEYQWKVSVYPGTIVINGSYVIDIKDGCNPDNDVPQEIIELIVKAVNSYQPNT